MEGLLIIVSLLGIIFAVLADSVAALAKLLSFGFVTPWLGYRFYYQRRLDEAFVFRAFTMQVTILFCLKHCSISPVFARILQSRSRNVIFSPFVNRSLIYRTSSRSKIRYSWILLKYKEKGIFSLILSWYSKNFVYETILKDEYRY